MQKLYPNNILSDFWLGIWAVVLSVSWLLPNHYQPWLAFHLDAWTAMCAVVAAIAVFWRAKSPTPMHWLAILVSLLVFVPGLQSMLGLIPLSGVAWISSAYMVGFFLALVVGAQWEANEAGQLGDGLFIAIGIAALLSVGLQLQQWLQIDGIELWKMGGGPERPFANFGQPNHAGTFLLWGLLAVGWGWVRRTLGWPVALLMSVFLLFGLALTASRTAWIGMTLLVVACWVWRRLWRSPRLPFIVTGLGLYFVLCVTTQAWLRAYILDGAPLPAEYLSPLSGQHRLMAWAAFWDAIWQRPWFGYGWYQVVPAQMAVAVNHPELHGVFTSTHNLFLDFFIWCGVPIGVLMSISLLTWGWQKTLGMRHSEDAILLLLLAVVFNHAMLELPLHYAYFLLPVGLVIGVLNTRLEKAPVFLMPRWVSICIWLAATFMLAIVIWDYARIEPSHENFRMEKMHIKVAHISAPDVLILTQWRDFIEVSRLEPSGGMKSEQIDQMRRIAYFFAGPFLIHKLATALALNNQGDEAEQWLKRLCKSSPVKDCTEAQHMWSRQSLKHPEIAAIPWPK